MNSRSYEEGLQAGKVEAMEEILKRHDDRLNHHSNRLRMLERVAWIMIGAVGLFQALPVVSKIVLQLADK